MVHHNIELPPLPPEMSENALKPKAPPSSLHIMLDIEALGIVAGSAIIELGAVAFDMGTGSVGEGFHVLTCPDDRFTQDADTLAWHAKQGTWPRETTAQVLSIDAALLRFSDWLEAFGAPIGAFWSWGSTYDFPLLDQAFRSAGVPSLWRYRQQQCARTIWNLAFPGIRHTSRPHDALKDSIAAANDLIAALNHLGWRKEAV